MSENLDHLWRKMKRAHVTELLVLETMKLMGFHNRVFRDVSVSKAPDFIPIPWAEKYHIDVCTLEIQRREGNRPFEIRGYEIKSCRADFRSDKKWRNYLGRTDRFFFVTPPGVIKPDELVSLDTETPEPLGVGLIEMHLEVLGGTVALVTKWVKGARTYPVTDRERFDTMYGMAISNYRDNIKGRLKLDRKIDRIIKGYAGIPSRYSPKRWGRLAPRPQA